MRNIKKLLLVATLLLVTQVTEAQQTIKPIESWQGAAYADNPNTYFKDTNNKLQDMASTWVYDNGTDYFKITFYKMKSKVNEKHNVYADVLLTKFLYKKNNIVIYDNYGTNSYLPGTVNMKPSGIESSFVKNSVISFVYTEPSTNDCHRRRVGSLNIIYSSNPTPSIQWKRITDERYFLDMPCDNGVEPDNSDFVIPADMVLIKQ